MTEQELDDYLVTKTTSALIESKMAGTGIIALGSRFYENLLVNNHGWLWEEARPAVRESLTRLLRAERVYAAGIRGWTTDSNARTTPQRMKQIREVIAGEREYTTDMDYDPDIRPIRHS